MKFCHFLILLLCFLALLYTPTLHRIVVGDKDEYDVVIVGTGPSAMALLFFLTHDMTYLPRSLKADGALHFRFQSTPRLCDFFLSNDGASIIHEDLLRDIDSFRTNQSIVYDALNLKYPDWHTGAPWLHSNIVAQPMPRRLRTLVVTPTEVGGGTWQLMVGEYLTLSPAWWMLMPEEEEQKTLNGHIHRLQSLDRVRRQVVTDYYRDYFDRLLERSSFELLVDRLQRLEFNDERHQWSLEMNARHVHANAVVLAIGQYEKPKKLQVEGERAAIMAGGAIEYRIPSSAVIKASGVRRVVVVGAGLSAADAIASGLLPLGNIEVYHLFNDTKEGRDTMEKFYRFDYYPEYDALYQLMINQTQSPNYHAPLRGVKVGGIDEEGGEEEDYNNNLKDEKSLIRRIRVDASSKKLSLQLRGSRNGEPIEIDNIDKIYALIGSRPNFRFISNNDELRTRLEQLAEAAAARVAPPADICDLRTLTLLNTGAPSTRPIYTLGLTANPFVRYTHGPALAVACQLLQQQQQSSNNVEL